MPYYPEVTVIQGLTRVRRVRRLPPQAAPRPTHTITGAPVDAIHVVLEGDLLRDYRILDVAKALKLKRVDPERLDEMIEVSVGQRVQLGTELARRGRRRRAKVLHSPATGQVVKIDEGRIILQVSEQTVEVKARIPGEVEEVEPHYVRLTGQGALIQCAWGNGHFVYQTYRFLPEGGFVELSKLDVRISEYRHIMVISPVPITKGDLLVAQQQEVAGVVAPSMPVDLREFALQLTFPVLLTEGFGQRRRTELIYTLLRSNMGRQAAFDAAIPDRWASERPEIMIPLPSGGHTPPFPSVDEPLQVGAKVRITRAPWESIVGKVTDLPDAPQQIDNGLRVPSARVQVTESQTVLVPLANLELLG